MDMKAYTRVYAKIDLDAVVQNMETLKAGLAKGTGMMGVVKTDGYGHGAVPIAMAIAPYVTGYAVATIEEARNLQLHGIEKPILILGVTHPSHSLDLVRYDIRPTIFTMEQAEAVSKAAVSLKKTARIHLAVDTGMNRIGMTCDQAGADLAAMIGRLPGILTEGVFTHFARADEEDPAPTRRQLGRYQGFLRLLAERGMEVPVRHIANSAAAIGFPEAHFDIARAGIAMYGIYPSNETERMGVKLCPVLSLHSVVTYVKEIPEGAEVSYGGTFRADKPMKIATIPIGYGDGYPRSLSGRGQVLIRGQRAPVLGRICMDQLMADVTRIPGVGVDDPVTLIGRDGSERITVEELEAVSGGFRYEIVCDIGKRVPRVYMQEGRVIGTKDYLDDRYEDFVTEPGKER